MTIKEIENAALAHKGVSGVHGTILHKYSQTQIKSLHIEIPDASSSSELHSLSEEVEEKITQRLGGKTIVRIDPTNKEHLKYEKNAETIKKITSAYRKANSIHGLRIICCEVDKWKDVFDIGLEQDTDGQKTYDIIRSITGKFNTLFPEMKTVINSKPKYVYSI